MSRESTIEYFRKKAKEEEEEKRRAKMSPRDATLDYFRTKAQEELEARQPNTNTVLGRATGSKPVVNNSTTTKPTTPSTPSTPTTPTTPPASTPTQDTGRNSAAVQYEIDELAKQRTELERERAALLSNRKTAVSPRVKELGTQIAELRGQLDTLKSEAEELEKAEKQALIDSGEYRDASFWDYTINSLKQGWYNSMYGAESFYEMTGADNEKQKYEDILAGEDYKFIPSNGFEEAISGAANQIGQQFRQWTHPRSLATGTAAALAAGIAGQAGPQVLLPEEVITMPTAFMAGIAAGSATSNFEIEAGFAYNEMLEQGISPETAKKIAVAVGGVNAALEMVQADELLKSFKVLKGTKATQGVASRIAKELLDRGIDVTKETAQEVLQEGATIAGTQIGSKIDTGEWAYSAGEVKDRLGDTAKSSMLTFGTLNVPGGTYNTYNILRDQQNQQTTQQTAPIQQDPQVQNDPDAAIEQAALELATREAEQARAEAEIAPQERVSPMDVSVPDRSEIVAPRSEIEAAAMEMAEETMRREQQTEETTAAERENTTQERETEAEAAQESTRSEALAEEMTLQDAMEAFNGGGKYDVINREAVEQAAKDGTISEVTETQEAAKRADGATSHGVAVLTNYARQAHMGENGLKAIEDFYDANENPETAPFYGGFAAYWNAGYNDKAFEEVSLTRDAISDVVKHAAYNAGKLDAIQENAAKPVEIAGAQEYNGTKTSSTTKKKTITTKKSDWASTDVEWRVPNAKRPIAYSTKATSDYIEVLADENPAATISELQGLVNYDQDAKKVLQQYIDAGHGDQVASEWFSYDRRRGYTKEDIANGNIEGEHRENEAGHQAGPRGVRENDTGRTGESGRPELRSELLEEVDVHGRRDGGRGVSDGPWGEADFTEPDSGSAATEARETAASYGVECFVVSDEAWGRSAPASSRGGKMYLRRTIPEGYKGMIAPHELTHIMKQLGYQPYINFIERTPDMMDFGTEEAKRLFKDVLAHRKLEVDDLADNDVTNLYDELNAAIYGHVASGKLSEENLAQLRAAFYDYDAYIAELTAIHEGFKNRNNNAKKQADTAEKQTKPTPKAETPATEKADNPQRAIADELLKYIKGKQEFSPARLYEIADKHYGGSMASGAYTVKDAYDAMELAVNRYLIEADFVKKGNGNTASARVTLKRLVEVLKRLPTQTKRTAEQESYQQFSTPPNIAYLAAWTANIDANDVALEPSAGIGGLALWPKAWGAKVYGNELSERRLAFLNELGLDGTYNLNAEQIDNLLPDDIKPSVVIMNPPFSSTAGRTAKNNTANAKRHIEQALDRLEDGGRLIAILGNGMADDAPAFRSWWDELRQEYSVRANIRIDGENYRKYGTTFDVQMVVIDKTGPSSAPTLTGTYKDLTQIPDVMEEIRNDRTRKDGTREVLHDSNPVAGRTSEPRADNKRSSDEEHSSGTSSDVRGRGEQRGKDSKKSASERNAGKGDRETVRGSERELGEGNTGSRMALSGVAQSDMDGGTAGELTDNPDSVFATYSPNKVHISGAKKHPAKLVESAAMAAVEPPDVTYTPALPAKIAEKGILSDAQLENVVYAGQAHEQLLSDGRRKGYFIGDGTGVGKGRQISGIIMDNFLQGRTRAIWISEKQGLYEDAIRDWTDLGGKKDDIINFSKFKLGEGIKAERGIMFSTYDTLKTEKDNKSRIKDLERWLGKDFDGVICFDEAHNMANSAGKQGKRGSTKPSSKALAGIELQKIFPKARVVYASATGATDVSDYAYLERLGLWGPGTAFHNAEDFISKISTGGLAAMELVARDMKSMGVYMARSISYDDVKYDTLQHDLNPMQTEIYNTMSRAWQTVYQNMSKALEITGANMNGQARANVNSAFYGTQQRFYNQIITSMAMPSVIEDMRKELANGRSCILQIVNTNEAQAERAISAAEKAGLSLDDLDLTPSETLIAMVQKAFPIQEYEEYTDEKGNTRTRPVTDGEGNPVLSKKAIRMRDELIADLRQMKVPDGPLEMLFDAFGVDQVAEVTGRSRRVVEKADEHGRMHRTIEKISKKAGIADAQMFQDGKKRILVFSDAGGTGRSYHADLRAKNQQQRVHYLLQPGWNASKATQGFGRSHRSNQAVAPIFRLVTTNVMGQKRFTSTIARRLDQLGALTKGQRQAGSGIFGEKDNLEGPIAQDALQQYYKTLSSDVLKKLGLYNSIYDSSGKLNEGSADLRDIGKFLNRILSLEVDEQNEVFQGFYDTFDHMMDVAIANGTVDTGLENYRAEKIEVKDEKVIRKDASGADTKYVQMTTFHKPELISYSKVQGLHQNFQGIVRTEDGSVRAVYEISSKTNARTGEIQRRFKLESPVKGKASVFVEKTLNEQTKPVDKADWKKAWAEETAKAPEYNESVLHLLTGTLLPIWDKLPANNTRVMRVISSDGRQYLGRVIRPDQIDGVLRTLGSNRTMQTYTPQQVSEAVLQQGKEVIFRDNKLRLTRRRVSGEWRMELSGQNIWYVTRSIPAVISERINYEYRYFMPTGNNDALQALMDANPVVDIRDSVPEGDVDYMRSGEATDHSAEWTASRVGSTDKQPMRLSEIIEKIRRDFDLNITTGHIRGKGVRGQFSQSNSGIRTKVANDLPTVAHELGHYLDREFDLIGSITEEMKRELLDNMDEQLAATYTKKQQLGEGLAEYVRKYLQNRETAAIDYPEFTKHFMNTLSGRDAAQIKQLADEVNAYYSLDADTATSSIRLREEGNPDARTAGEKIKAKMSVLYQAWMDSNQGIKEFDKATGSNTYKLASNAAYSDAIAGQLITGDLTDANGQYVAPGLKTALHGLNLKDKTEYRMFGEYLTVKHGPERLAEGMRIFADDRKNSSAFMARRQAELEQQYPHFAEVAERLYEFQKQFLQTWGVGTGLVSSQSAKDWAERWEFYVPLNRAVSEEQRRIGAKRGFANQNSTIKKARGSGLDVVHPVDNIVNNIVKMVNAGVRNNVMRAITDAAQSHGADATYIEKVPTPLVRRGFDMTGVKTQLTDWLEDSGMNTSDKELAAGVVNNLDDILYQYGKGKAHGDVITVLKGGEQEFWKINDPQLLASVTTMAPKKMEGILDAYAVVSRFMTSNITGNNLIWSLFSNFPRDIMTMFTYSKVKNPARMFGAMGSAFVNKVKDGAGMGVDPLYQEFLAMGGGKTSAYTADRDLAKRARKKLAGMKISANPLDWVSYVGDLIELGPRFATYKVLRQNGMSSQEAFYEAMDITVNFRRGGTVSRELNKVIPFFNASVQGLDKFRRWITAEEVNGAGRKKVVAIRTISYIAASAALAAIVYALNNGDDEDEKNYEQLSNFTKNSYWSIPMGDGKYLTIPKPREIAVLSSFFETSMEYGIGDNDHAFDEFYAYAADNFLPPIASDVAKGDLAGVIGNFGIVGVGSYMVANRDFLGRPIVSAGLQNLEPKDQYTDRTSKIAYWVGRAFNASPQMVDYFFNSVLGGWWKTQKALFPVGKENVDVTLGIQNSYVKDNQYSTDLVNWMYDKADASKKAKNSDKANMKKAITAKMDGNMTSFYSDYYALAKSAADTTANRGARQVVLDMILEYRKASDAGTVTKAQAAVYDIVEAAKDTEYLPGVMPSTIKDGQEKEHTLSPTQYVEYQTDYNRLYWEYVEEALPDAHSDAEKLAVLSAAKTVAKENATAATLARIGAAASKFTAKYSGVSADNVIDFLAGVTVANDDGSVKQNEVVDVINGMDVSDAEAWTLYFSRYDGKAAHDAHKHGIPAELYMNAKLEMENIKPDYINGKEVPGSRRAKIERYLNSVVSDYREYLFLLGTEFESVKKDYDYIMFFGG